MKNKFFAAIILLMLILCFTACAPTQESISSNVSNSASQEDVVSASSSSESPSSVSSQESSQSTSSKTTPVFTNKFGTATTKCNHSGCTNYIASSGDTNCCTTHSNNCLECGKYIDEDAAWCMSCAEATLNSILEEKKEILNKDCDICGKQATQTINGEYYCDKHYAKAAEWYSEQSKK